MTGKHKILVVDDGIANIYVLTEILQDDYEIIFATNGNDALELAVEEKPDLILLDVIMPEMDGYQVCSKLKTEATTQHIPIIFISARAEVEDEARGLEIGAVDYITKPVSPPIVRARVKNHLELTAGNLSAHTSRLEEAGYVNVEKRFAGKYPRTTLSLTTNGRSKFEEYRQQMRQTLDNLPSEDLSDNNA